MISLMGCVLGSRPQTPGSNPVVLLVKAGTPFFLHMPKLAPDVLNKSIVTDAPDG
jgi:hypothetical protein